MIGQSVNASDDRRPGYALLGNTNGRLQSATFWFLILILAWAPFPLGSNRPWSWSLLALLVSLCWGLWLLSVWDKSDEVMPHLRRIIIPVMLGLTAVCWGWIQTLTYVPVDWAHPVWLANSEALEIEHPGAVSVDPWRTLTAVMKILTYGAAFWLVYVMAARPALAERLLDALIAIGTAYAFYALILGYLGIRQFEIFYPAPTVGSSLAGPFVLHNNFATYVGLVTLCGLARLFCIGTRAIVIGAGIRNFTSSFAQFLFGPGLFSLLAVILCFSMLVASGSRAGFFATLVGGMTLLLFSLPLATRRETIGWAGISVVGLTLFAIVLFQINGATLQMRFDSLVEAGGLDPIRVALWNVAIHIITDEPVLGVGLGTYETAYPLYSEQFLPYSIDKAHNDYLELAAGWGVPAAASWLLALAWFVGLCLRALFIGRRNRVYPLLALGATALVAFHSAFDFSLQIPAIALSYAAILGLGVAQAFPANPQLPRGKNASL